MFNLANLVKAVVTVAAVANTVIRQVAKSNPQVAKVVQAVDHFVQQSRQSRRDSDDADERGSTRDNRGNRKGLRTTQKQSSAAPVVNPKQDIAEVSGGIDPDNHPEGDGEAAQTVPTLREQAAAIGRDIDEWLQGELPTAELLVAVAHNPVAQALLQMMRHERSHLQFILNNAPSTTACMIATFGQASEDDEDTIQAARLCDMAMSDRNDPDGRFYLAYADENLARLLTESEVDPCEGLVGEALDRCRNEENLRTFGVTVAGNSPEDPFSVRQLQTLNMTVEQVGTFLANQAAAEGYDLTPEEAFQAILGNVEFILDPTLEDQPGKTEGQTIRLRADAVSTDYTLIPAHELGHILQNRLGQTEEKTIVQVAKPVEIIDDKGNIIAVEERSVEMEVPGGTPIVAVQYAVRTGGQWYPFGDPIWERDEAGRLLQKRDQAGNLMWNQDREPGYYDPADYVAALRASIKADDALFFNELRKQTNPTEGFADTFAILTMRGRDLLFDDPRGKFFDEQMPYWIKSMIDPIV